MSSVSQPDHRQPVSERGGDVRGRQAVDEQDDVGAVVDRPADVVDWHHAAAPAHARAADRVVDLCGGGQRGGRARPLVFASLGTRLRSGSGATPSATTAITTAGSPCVSDHACS
jgi:hypothetical protein